VRVTLTSRAADADPAPTPSDDKALKPSLQLKSGGGQ